MWETWSLQKIQAQVTFGTELCGLLLVKFKALPVRKAFQAIQARLAPQVLKVQWVRKAYKAQLARLVRRAVWAIKVHKAIQAQ